MMADVRDWDAFIRGRWRWQLFGYESGLPRGSGFGDEDATLELNGRLLYVESKSWDGVGTPGLLKAGQERKLRVQCQAATVWVLYGCASCDDPMILRQYMTPARGDDLIHDWTGLTKVERRRALRTLILDWANWAEKGGAVPFTGSEPLPGELDVRATFEDRDSQLFDAWRSDHADHLGELF